MVTSVIHVRSAAWFGMGSAMAMAVKNNARNMMAKVFIVTSSYLSPELGAELRRYYPEQVVNGARIWAAKRHRSSPLDTQKMSSLL